MYCLIFEVVACVVGMKDSKFFITLFSHVLVLDFLCNLLLFYDVYSLSYSNELGLFPSCFLLQGIFLISTVACGCLSDPCLISKLSISR